MGCFVAAVKTAGNVNIYAKDMRSVTDASVFYVHALYIHVDMEKEVFCERLTMKQSITYIYSLH